MTKFRWLTHLAALLLIPTASSGMDFSKQVVAQGTVLYASGPIKLGDDQRLHEFVAGLPRSTKVIGMAMSSQGGNLLEGLRMGRTVRSSGLFTLVPESSVCASACFLMFAAGRTKFVGEAARIGVHSATSGAGEDTMSQAATVMMAREASQYGVPSAVVGHMVTTLATGISWLTTDELKEMGVQFLPPVQVQAAYEPGSPLVPGGAAEASSAAPSVPAVEVSPAFRQGRADRVNWEQWFASLADDIKSGAEWWANNRKYAAKNHLTCNMQATFSPSFISGCQRAQSYLNPADRRRLAEPDYRSGWNSL